jgi:hypothetical protein
MKARWIAVPLVLAAVVGGLLRRDREPEGRPAVAPAVPAARPEVVVQDGLTVVGGTGFDLHYRSPGTSPQEDLRAVAELLDAATLLVKDIERFPLPDNPDFTAFLQGRNPHRVAWIRPGHPAVSPRGELLDRWEMPVFFHKESSRRTSLRSAGPDRKMWTADDIVWPEP